MPYCEDHRYNQSCIDGISGKVDCLQEDIRKLTDMTSTLIQAQAIGDANRTQIRTEIDCLAADMRSIKDSVVEIRVIREKILGDIRSDRETITKDLDAAFRSIRKIEGGQNILAEELEDLKKIKAEILASYRMIKFLLAGVAAMASAATWIVDKLISK